MEEFADDERNFKISFNFLEKREAVKGCSISKISGKKELISNRLLIDIASDCFGKKNIATLNSLIRA